MPLPLSRNHGFNPAIPKCYFCGKNKNEIILAGRLPGDREAPKGAIWDSRPCDKCAEYMKQGVLLISIRDDQVSVLEEHSSSLVGLTRAERRRVVPPNPFRTGGWVVVKREAFKRFFSGESADAMLKAGFGFVPDSVWDAVGLPRGPVEGVPSE